MQVSFHAQYQHVIYNTLLICQCNTDYLKFDCRHVSNIMKGSRTSDLDLFLDLYASVLTAVS